MRSLRKQRAGALVATAAMVASGGVGAIAASTVTATGAAAAGNPANVTFVNNACTTSAQPNSPSNIAISLGSAQTDAALAVGVDTTTGFPLAGGLTVGDLGADGTAGGTFTPSAGVLVGGTGTLTTVGGSGFVSAAFLQAGVGLGFIQIGQTIPATITMTIDAANATFAAQASQAAGVTVVSPTEVTVSGSGSGTLVGVNDPSGDPTLGTVTEPLEAKVQYPDIKYAVGSDASVNAYFYQAAPVIPGFPGNGTGASANTSARIIATAGALNIPLGCVPGVAPNPQTTPATWTATPTSGVSVFAAVDIAPAQAPTLQPQTISSVNLNGSVIINTLNGATGNVGVDPASVTVVSAPAHGTTSVDPATGRITYSATSTSSTTPADSFTVTAAAPAPNGSLVSLPVTITISTIIANPSSCNATTAACTLKQIIVVPVQGSTLTMGQSAGLPQDIVGGTLDLASGQCTSNPLVLNGDVQFACGLMDAVTVVNARGTDSGWTLSGQVTDFVDPAQPQGTTCSTTATYQNHCIPGGNLSWLPVAAVGHTVVPGDVAQVNPGVAVLGGLTTRPPSLTNAAGLVSWLAPGGVATQPNPAIAAAGKATQPNPSPAMAAAAGLHDSPQTLCVTGSGTSGGTFVCSAALIVAVPASAAAVPSGYTATLTLTLV